MMSANNCKEVETKVNKMFGVLGLEYKKKEGRFKKMINRVKKAFGGNVHKGEASGVKKGPNNEKYIELQKHLLEHDFDDEKV
ncbi:unnamed protein product [Meloidogyne enterolobii]|uniref:Uncharacterized protein n=1 Tax=Meloidogyne enterolobii TaxID=390850 RepID=A0ACB0Y631_MELEN